MTKLRVLVVDDSVVMRRLVGEVLSADPEIVVVGTASSGKVALSRLSQLAPDLVVLDVEMPDLDGLATLAALRKTHQKLPVIMFTAATQRAAAAMIEALMLGANDYVTKPDGIATLDQTRERIRTTLVTKIKNLLRPATVPSGTTTRIPRIDVRPQTGAIAAIDATRPVTTSIPKVRLKTGLLPNLGSHGARARTIRAIAIGVSTGGPLALERLFAELHTLSVPIFVVQHMPPVFTAMLAQRLAKVARMPVVEAVPGTRVEPGCIYIAPGDRHMVVVNEDGVPTVRCTQDPPENSCRPAVDVLFRSVATIYGSEILAVVMTGMGQDGLRGCEHVRDHGGTVIVQDAATSVVWGMPGAVVRAGLADAIVPLPQLALELERRCDNGAAHVATGMSRG